MKYYSSKVPNILLGNFECLTRRGTLNPVGSFLSTASVVNIQGVKYSYPPIEETADEFSHQVYISRSSILKKCIGTGGI